LNVATTCHDFVAIRWSLDFVDHKLGDSITSAPGARTWSSASRAAQHTQRDEGQDSAIRSVVYATGGSHMLPPAGNSALRIYLA
jgi:hypothetical protein